MKPPHRFPLWLSFLAFIVGSLSVLGQTAAPALYWDERRGPDGDTQVADMAGVGPEYVCAIYNGSVNAASTKLLWRTTDGLGWGSVSSPSVNSVEALGYGNGTYLALAWRGSSRLLLKSTDGGVSWTEQALSADLSSSSGWGSSLSYANGRWWLAVNYSGWDPNTYQSVYGTKFFVSTNNGTSWTQSLFASSGSYSSY